MVKIINGALLLNYVVDLIFNSFICASAMVEGVSIITSRPELFLGNAITSRIESSPAKIDTSLSKPKAMPVRRGAVFKGIHQKAKLLLGFFGRKTKMFKHE